MKNIDWNQAINNFIFRISFVIGILFLVIGLISSTDGTNLISILFFAIGSFILFNWIDKLIEYIDERESDF